MGQTKFSLNIEELKFSLLSIEEKTELTIQSYMVSKAPTIEAKMKKNRPWTDRTGLAKQRLTAKVSKPKKGIIRLTLAHGVDYGIWLELANDKNYAIIAPTLKRESTNIIRGLRRIFIK